MRKIINSAEHFVDEVLEGILLAHPDHLTTAPGSARAIVTVAPTRPGRVAIATGGGSGHLPLFLGFVGDGLVNGAAVGNVFSSPSSEDMLAATRAIEAGAGVLYLYGNYGGDVFNFDSAAELAAREGIRVTTVLGTDDIVSASIGATTSRRGVAGLSLAFKTAGAAARRGLSLEQVAAIARRTIDGTRTMGVGLSPTILPEAGTATFSLDDGEMEIGVGIHGETGQYRGPIESADAIADRFVDTLLGEVSGDRVAVLINGLGATPLEELYLLYRRVATRLHDSGITIAHRYIGEYATSLEMAGASVSLCALDSELESLLDEPVDAAFFSPWAPAPRGIYSHRSSVAPTHAPAAPETVVAISEADRASARAMAELISEAARLWADASDELRQLDSALGDGDLGITVARGCTAMIEALTDLPGDLRPSSVIISAARVFGTANPSTFAALASLAGTALGEALSDAPEDWLRAVEAAFTAVQSRGGAVVGDKTLLDPLAAVVDAVRADSGVTLRELVEIAEAATVSMVDTRSARGRAAWAGERSEGHLDPGSVALVRLLAALRDAVGASPEAAQP